MDSQPMAAPGNADPAAHSLACTEVWGGNRRVAHDVGLPGLSGFIHSIPYGEAAGGGDVYYLSACSQGLMARVALADVSGHGQGVSTLAGKLRDLMHKHIDTWDQTILMAELNQSFPRPERGVKFATVVLLGFYSPTGELLYTSAGHMAPLWYRAATREWTLMAEDDSTPVQGVADLPLGLIPGTNYRQTLVNLAPGDLLVLYTDALTEAMDAAGEELGTDGLLRLAQTIPDRNPGAVAQDLLAAVRAFRADQTLHDDETLIVLQRHPA